MSAYLGSCTRFQSPSALSYCPSSHSAAARAALGSSKSGYLLRRLLSSTQHALCPHKPAQGAPSHLACTGTNCLATSSCNVQGVKQVDSRSYTAMSSGEVDIQDSRRYIDISRYIPHFSHSLVGLPACIKGKRSVRSSKAEGWRKLYSLLIVSGRLCPLLLCKSDVPCSASQIVTGAGGQAPHIE